MRRAARVDDNHREIISALEAMGMTVLDLSAVGKGCPDLLVGRAGVNYLLEVKDGNKPPSKRKLTPDQVRFFETWGGQVAAVKSIDEVIRWANSI